MSYDTAVNDVGTYIAALARQRGVTYVRTGLDELADVITRLADDEVITDPTEDTLVALARANVIDGRTMSSLLGRYLDAKFNGV